MYLFCVHMCVFAYACVEVSVYHCIYVDVRVQHVSISLPFIRSIKGIKFGQKIFRQTSLLGCPPWPFCSKFIHICVCLRLCVYVSVCLCACRACMCTQGLKRAWDVFLKHSLHVPLCEADDFLNTEPRFSSLGWNPTILSIPLSLSPWELGLQACIGYLAGFSTHYCTVNNLSCWAFYLVLKSSQFLPSPLTSINIFKWRLLVRFLRFQSVLLL